MLKSVSDHDGSIIEDIQVLLLNVQDGFPGVKAFAYKGIEVLLKAQTLEKGGDICHSRALGVASMPESGLWLDDLNQGNVLGKPYDGRQRRAGFGACGNGQKRERQLMLSRVSILDC